jgi:hypothetical protein
LVVGAVDVEAPLVFDGRGVGAEDERRQGVAVADGLAGLGQVVAAAKRRVRVA